jgi:hypothetical protein
MGYKVIVEGVTTDPARGQGVLLERDRVVVEGVEIDPRGGRIVITAEDESGK